VIVVPRKYERRVYVFGNLEQSGVFYFEEKEPMTLEVLLSKMKYDMNQLESAVELIRDGIATRMIIDDDRQDPLRFSLESNDILVIRKVQQRYVYVTGIKEKSKIEFEPEEVMSVIRLFGKLGLPSQSVSELRIITAAGISRVYKTDNGLPTVTLSIGDIVEFPPENYVYVSGNVVRTGKIDFSYFEAFTLKNLLAVLGIGDAESFSVNVTYPDGQTYRYDFPDTGNKIIPLQRGAFIEFPYKRYVLLAGDISEDNTLQLYFPNEEKMTLRTALAKTYLDTSEQSYEVTIIRDKEHFTFSVETAFYSDTDFPLESGDILLFEKKNNRYIQLISSDGNSQKLAFLPDEPLTLLEVLLKYEKTGELTGDQIKIIEPTGRIFISSVKAVLSLAEDFDLVPKSVIIINGNERRVYVLGNVEKSGEFYFETDETFILDTLIAKCNPKLGEETESVLIRDSKGIKAYEPKNLFDSESPIPLEKDAIVYFKPYEIRRVYVFGKVNSPGILTFQKEEVLTLLSALTKSGGFQTDASKHVRVIDPDGKISVYNLNSETNPAAIPIQPDSYLLVDSNTSQFVAILGDVVTPGLVYLQKEEMTLLELLGSKGGVKDWTLNTTVEITRSNGKKELVAIDSDPSSLNTTRVRSGDTVFVYPSSRLKVYVFGSVTNPGIVPYHSKITLLEALLYCKGPSSSAYLRKVMVFPGGVEANPVLFDYSGFRKEQGVVDYNLQPGDVVYVPENAMVEIKDIVSFLSTMLTFVNSGITFIDKLQ
jgi:polysaccharide export outer membrane protein